MYIHALWTKFWVDTWLYKKEIQFLFQALLIFIVNCEVCSLNASQKKLHKHGRKPKKLVQINVKSFKIDQKKQGQKTIKQKLFEHIIKKKILLLPKD